MTEYGCSNHYCFLKGQRKGVGTNSGCSCLRGLNTALRLAIERRIRFFEAKNKMLELLLKEATK